MESTGQREREREREREKERGGGRRRSDTRGEKTQEAVEKSKKDIICQFLNMIVFSIEELKTRVKSVEKRRQWMKKILSLLSQPLSSLPSTQQDNV